MWFRGGPARDPATISHGEVSRQRTYLQGRNERRKAMMVSPNAMMDGMGAMVWSMGLVWLLVAVVLLLGAAALAKYVFFNGSHGG